MFNKNNTVINFAHRKRMCTLSVYSKAENVSGYVKKHNVY